MSIAKKEFKPFISQQTYVSYPLKSASSTFSNLTASSNDDEDNTESSDSSISSSSIGSPVFQTRTNVKTPATAPNKQSSIKSASNTNFNTTTSQQPRKDYKIYFYNKAPTSSTHDLNTSFNTSISSEHKNSCYDNLKENKQALDFKKFEPEIVRHTNKSKFGSLNKNFANKSTNNAQANKVFNYGTVRNYNSVKLDFLKPKPNIKSRSENNTNKAFQAPFANRQYHTSSNILDFKQTEQHIHRNESKKRSSLFDNGTLNDSLKQTEQLSLNDDNKFLSLLKTYKSIFNKLQKKIKNSSSQIFGDEIEDEPLESSGKINKAAKLHTDKSTQTIQSLSSLDDSLNESFSSDENIYSNIHSSRCMSESEEDILCDLEVASYFRERDPADRVTKTYHYEFFNSFCQHDSSLTKNSKPTSGGYHFYNSNKRFMNSLNDAGTLC